MPHPVKGPTDRVTLCLPPLLQLGWCERGPEDHPWFLPPEAARPLLVTAQRPIEYADPVAVAMLGAWAVHWRARGREIALDHSLQSPYAWRSGLLSALAGRYGQTHLGTDRQMQAQVRHEDDIQVVVGALRTVMHVDDTDTADAAAYCLSELLRNVFEHSGSPVGGFVAAGWFPKTDRVTIAVVDLGMTVPRHVSQRWPGAADVTPEQALTMALEPRVTGSRDHNRNAGLGLYMTRRLVALMGGKFWMLTGGLVARDEGEVESGRRTTLSVQPTGNAWQGTCVALSFRPRRIGSFRRELSLAQMELAGGVAGQRLEQFRKAALPGSTIVRIGPDVSTIAQDKIAAERIRREQIMPALQRGEALSIDLSGIALTTQSFIHALLAEPLRTLGTSAIAERLWFIGTASQVKQVIRIVTGYVLDEVAP